MKKIVAIVVLVLYVCSFIVAKCESINLDSLSDKELIELRNRIDEILSKELDDVKPWYDHGLGRFLPDPNVIIGRQLKSRPYSQMNTDGTFSETVTGITYEEYGLYAKAIKSYGYNESIQEYGFGYSAILNGKYQVTLMYADLPSNDTEDYMMVILDIVS